MYLSVVSVEIYAMKEAASIGEKTKEGSFVFLCVFLYVFLYVFRYVFLDLIV